MTTSSTIQVVHAAGVHRYAAEHWQLLRPFVEGREQDPKGLFYLTDDSWDLWPYSRHAIASYASRYRVKFHGLRSFIKPFVKWYCYQQILQRPGDLSTSMTSLPYELKCIDTYLIERGYFSLDDLAPLSTFEEVWAAPLPQKSMPYTYLDVRRQNA